jgi:hypothetical protein
MDKMSAKNWQRFDGERQDRYLDTGVGRLTVRPAANGEGYVLRVMTDIVGVFATLEAAMAEGDIRARQMIAMRQEEDAWYASAFQGALDQ